MQQTPKPKLDERRDRAPFSCDLDAVSPLLKAIDEDKDAINRYFEFYPAAKRSIDSAAARRRNFMRGARSFLSLDGNLSFDVTPTEIMTKEERAHEVEKMHKVENYYEACKFIRETAQRKDYYEVDKPLLIRAHAMLNVDAERGNNVAAYRFRNEEDPEINDLKMHRFTFGAVPGELVELRVDHLLTLFNTTWYDDHPIVRGAKFVTEYFRIQPHMDGNKRTAFMALNFILLKGGYPAIYFQQADHANLMDAFESGIYDRDITPMVMMIAGRVGRRQDEIKNEIFNFRMGKFKEEEVSNEDKE